EGGYRRPSPAGRSARQTPSPAAGGRVEGWGHSPAPFWPGRRGGGGGGGGGGGRGRLGSRCLDPRLLGGRPLRSRGCSGSWGRGGLFLPDYSLRFGLRLMGLGRRNLDR